MADGYFERGEVYWVKMGSGVGCEMNVTRPGLIVSINELNNSSECVLIVFLTTKEHRTSWNKVTTFATGRESWVLCDQIQTVDKTRLTKYLGTLTYSEMKAVEDSLEKVFDLGYIDETVVKAKDVEIADRDVVIGDLKTEVAGVRAEIGKKDEEIASLKMEIEMWQKCYGRCMDMLVDTKVSADLKRRTVVEPKVGTAVPVAPVKIVDPEEPVIVPKKQPEEPKQPVEEPENRLDINSCTATALKKAGFSLSMARKIVEGRPYERVEDLKKLNGLKATLYNVLESKLCCVPVVVEQPEPEKKVAGTPKLVEPDPGYERVNVNTATAKELHEVLGLCMATCYSITGRRKKVGPYEKLDDLLGVANITPTSLERLGHLMEV